jgi:GGDEF domain-containing protein
MDAKTLRNLSAALVWVFIFSLVILLGGLAYQYRRGSENGGSIFAAIMDRVTTGETGAGGLPPEVTRGLDEYFLLNDNLAALTVHSGGRLIYSQPPASPYFTTGAEGIPQIQSTSPLLRVYNGPIQGTTLEVRALIFLIRPGEIFRSARLAFLMILAATVAAVLLLVYIKVCPQEIAPGTPPADKNPEPPAKLFVPPPAAPLSPEEDRDAPEDSETGGAPADDAHIAAISGEEDEADAASLEVTITVTAPVAEDILLPDPTIGDMEAIEELGPGDEVPPGEMATQEPLQDGDQAAPTTEPTPVMFPTAEESSPAGIYSPETGFVREIYLAEALAAQLRDAVKKEEDLALLLAAIPGLEAHPEALMPVCRALLAQFTNHDLIFQCTDQRFAVILGGAGIDAALTAAQALYLGLSDALAPLADTAPVGIAISTRMTRHISPMQLIAETQVALEKALADPENPIVALKIKLEDWERGRG